MKSIKVAFMCSIVAASCAKLSAQAFTVTTTNNHGKGSLREAIINANEVGGPSTISFDIPKKDSGYNKDSKSWQITLTEELPVITSEVHIDGYTQKKSHPNCNPINKPHSGCIKVELCGPGYIENDGLNGFTGLEFDRCGAYSTVRGLAVNKCQVGIKVHAHKVKILGCFLGVGVDGITPQPNLVSVLVDHDAEGTCIGSGRLESRNLISGCGLNNNPAKDATQVQAFEGAHPLGAITIYGNGTAVQNTTVNLTRDGDAVIVPYALYGIVALGAKNTMIGGPNFSDCSVIAGHKNANILFDSTCSDLVQHVLVGTDTTGTYALGGDTGLMFLQSYESEESCGHKVERSLFSGHTCNGIVLGSDADAGMVTGVELTRIKAGTDRTGVYKVPNEKHGVAIIRATDTVISESLLKCNGINGLFQKNGIGTIVRSVELGCNGKGGTCIETVPRPEDAYEIRVSKSQILGNGKNAIETPCGAISKLPRL